MNPFRYGEVVVDDDFCSRPELLRVLGEHIRASHKIALMGERRTGKTSLVFEAARRKRGVRLVYAQLWAVKSVTDVADRLLRGLSTAQSKAGWLERVGSLLARLRPTLEYDPLSGAPSLTVTPGVVVSPSGLHAVMDTIEKLSENTRLVVVLDEVQALRKLENGDALLGELRGRIQRQRGIPYIFAGSVRHEMEKLFLLPDSPFFKSLRIVEVGDIARRPFERFLGERFKSGGRGVTKDLWAGVFALSEGNPSDTQQLCAALWDTTEPGTTLSSEHISGALRHIFATERKGFESIVKPLTDNQLKCLKALVRVGGKQPQSKQFLSESGIKLPASVKRSLTRLVNLGVLYGPEREYKFFDPFFKQWMLSDMA
jgi:hypothetical protein